MTIEYTMEIYIPERLDPLTSYPVAADEIGEQVTIWNALGYQYKVVKAEAEAAL